MKTAEETEKRKKQILSKLPRSLREHWEDAYDLLTNRAHLSEEKAIDFANSKVRTIRRIERQLVNC
jgi:hypothetical protein